MHMSFEDICNSGTIEWTIPYRSQPFKYMVLDNFYCQSFDSGNGGAPVNYVQGYEDLLQIRVLQQKGKINQGGQIQDLLGTVRPTVLSITGGAPYEKISPLAFVEIDPQAQVLTTIVQFTDPNATVLIPPTEGYFRF